ncbi:uncharacterized protein LOC116266072 [Nymphaea colorata]|nr:uncharacterized protein LOC116266072 [Nymphaea colorata]
MAWVLELVCYAMVLAAKPFCLMMLGCRLCIGMAAIFVRELLNLVKVAWNGCRGLLWGLVDCFISVIMLPARVLTALRREKKLETHVQDLQRQLDCLLWQKKELEKTLESTIDDKEVLEAMLGEVEEDHDKSIAKIGMLEKQLRNLQEENRRLSNIQTKLSEIKAWEDSGVVDIGIPWNSGFSGAGAMFKGLTAQGHENISKARHAMFARNGSKPEQAYATTTISEKVRTVPSLDRRRDAALSQSLFSAFLSILVGVIVLEAEDPCKPLVIALFFVVVMSMRTVVQFFSTIDNRPASEAVALLSFNWFILGTLAYPTLPSLARLLSPLAVSLLNKLASWSGFSSIERVNT